MTIKCFIGRCQRVGSAPSFQLRLRKRVRQMVGHWSVVGFGYSSFCQPSFCQPSFCQPSFCQPFFCQPSFLRSAVCGGVGRPAPSAAESWPASFVPGATYNCARSTVRRQLRVSCGCIQASQSEQTARWDDMSTLPEQPAGTSTSIRPAWIAAGLIALAVVAAYASSFPGR